MKKRFLLLILCVVGMNLQASEIAFQKSATDKRKNVLIDASKKDQAKSILSIACGQGQQKLSESDQSLVKELLKKLDSFKKTSPREQEQNEVLAIALDLYEKGNKLLRAISTKNAQEAARLIEMVDVNDVRDCDGNSPLARALLEENSSVVALLLNKVNPNTINNKGLSPLDIALAYSQKDVAAELRRNKAQTGDEIRYQTALFDAVKKGKKGEVEKCLRDCSSLNFINFNSQSKTALDLASDKEIQKLLKNSGALTFEEWRQNALFLEAAQKKDSSKEELAALEEWAKKIDKEDLKRIVDAADDDGTTPLMHAVVQKKSDMVEFLIEKCGAAVNKINKQNLNCMDMAKEHNVGRMLMTFLRESGAQETNQAERLQKVSASFGKKEVNQQGEQQLAIRAAEYKKMIEELRADESKYFLAYATNGNVRGLKDLIAKGLIERNPQTDEGNSALACAVLGKQKEAVELLIAEGAHYDHCNKSEESVLDLAKRAKQKEIIKILEDKGAKEGVSIFLSAYWFEAAKEGDAGRIRSLAKARPDAIQLKNRDNKTALMVAAEFGQLDICKILIEELGAYMHEYDSALQSTLDPNVQRKTALDYAENLPYVRDYLKSRMALTFKEVVTRAGIMSHIVPAQAGQNANPAAAIECINQLFKKEASDNKGLFERGCRLIYSFNLRGMSIYDAIKEKTEYAECLKANELTIDQVPDNYKNVYNWESKRLAKVKKAEPVRSLLESDLQLRDLERVKKQAIFLANEGNKQILEMVDAGQIELNSDIADEICGDSLLHVAVRKSWKELVGGFLFRGWKPNRLNSLDETCLDIANITQFNAIRELLLKHGGLEGAEVKPKCDAFRAAATGDIGVLGNFLARGFSVDTANEEGNSLLAIAVMAGQIDTVKYLVSEEATINIINAQLSQSPLDQCQNPEIRDFLLQQGGCTASFLSKIPWLMKYAEQGQFDSFKATLETLSSAQRGDKLCKIKDENGKTPLMTAVSYGKLAFIKEILSNYGPDLDAVSKDKTALDLAKNPDIYNYLKGKGAHLSKDLPPSKTSASRVPFDFSPQKKSALQSPREPELRSVPKNGQEVPWLPLKARAESPTVVEIQKVPSPSLKEGIIPQSEKKVAGQRNLAEESKQLPSRAHVESPKSVLPLLSSDAEKKPTLMSTQEQLRKSSKGFTDEEAKSTDRPDSPGKRPLLTMAGSRLIAKAQAGSAMSRASQSGTMKQAEEQISGFHEGKLEKLPKERSKETNVGARVPAETASADKTKDQDTDLSGFARWYAKERGKEGKAKELLETLKKNPNVSVDEKDNTALHIAAQHGEMGWVKALVAAHANVNMLNADGESAYNKGNKEIKDYLTTKRAKDGATIKAFVEEIIRAMQKQNTDDVKAIVAKFDISPDACGINGQNAITYAAGKGFKGFITYFVETCEIADLNPLFVVPNLTPLDAAYTHNRQEVIKYLTDKGAKRVTELPKMTW